MADRTQTAAAVYDLLATRWPGRFGGAHLADRSSLGEDGLGLDSIEIVELLLECEERVPGAPSVEGLLDAGPIDIGRLIDHLAARS